MDIYHINTALKAPVTGAKFYLDFLQCFSYSSRAFFKTFAYPYCYALIIA